MYNHSGWGRDFLRFVVWVMLCRLSSFEVDFPNACAACITTLLVDINHSQLVRQIIFKIVELMCIA